MIVHQCVQGTAEWLAIRAGIPTASAFDRIITKSGKPSKSAEKYLHGLLAERLMGHPTIEAVSFWQGRGLQMEAEAIRWMTLLNAGAADLMVELGASSATDVTGFGFIGHACEMALGAGLVPVRKKGKLPYQTIEQSYSLEYGTNTLALHIDAIKPGQRALLVDDLLATGGTAGAAVALVQKLGAKLLGVNFLIELSFLNGRAKLPDVPIHSLVVY